MNDGCKTADRVKSDDASALRHRLPRLPELPGQVAPLLLLEGGTRSGGMLMLIAVSSRLSAARSGHS